MKGNAIERTVGEGTLLRLPGVELRLTAEQALRAAIDNQVFAALRGLESLDGGRAVQAVYVALVRRLPNVTPDRKRLAIDTGFSESSVKRAIKLLELCRLIAVEREPGKGSVFHLADIRSAEVASECVFAIRRVVRSEGQATSEPTSPRGRATSEPGTRVTSGPRVGSLLTHKVSKKIQDKQQCAAVENPDELCRVLSKWGLSSASYLVTPGHERAIPLLADNPVEAGRLIDRTMRKVAWSPAAGVGARVEYLRENVERAAYEAAATGRRKEDNREHARRRAEKVAIEFTRGGAEELGDVEPQRFAELLSRGLERLSEPAEVLEFLAADSAARAAIVGDELCRERIEKRVAAMTEAEFEKTCEELFSEQGGLRRLYPEKCKESTGLRLRIIEFLQESTTDVECLSREGRKEGGVRGNLERWFPDSSSEVLQTCNRSVGDRFDESNRGLVPVGPATSRIGLGENQNRVRSDGAKRSASRSSVCSQHESSDAHQGLPHSVNPLPTG